MKEREVYNLTHFQPPHPHANAFASFQRVVDMDYDRMPI